MTSEISRRPPRGLARATVWLFVLSTAFPVTAALLRLPTPSRGLGIADVAVAAFTVIASMTLWYRTRGTITQRHRLTAARWTDRVLALVPLLLAGFLTLGS